MLYFKIKNNDGSVDFGKCGKYMPVGSIEITEEEYLQFEAELQTNILLKSEVTE